MDIKRHGIILNTERYNECIDFYKQVFNLKTLFQLKEEEGSYLTCFEFGGAYLMIEREGISKDSQKSIAENPTKLRFNVSNIEAAKKHLETLGISAEVNQQAWGMTINIVDPDGNRIGIRDEAGFSAQMQ